MKITMFLFLRLMLAHFIGDFLLQSDEVYRVKTTGFYGALIHYFIIFFTFLLFSIPYLKYPTCWLIIIFASFTHIIQDEIKLRIITAPKLNFLAFVADQILHIIFISPALLFSLANIVPSGDNLFVNTYNNNSLVIVLMGYMVSTFMGAYLWESFKISYSTGNLPVFDKTVLKYGMFERFVITTAFLKGGYLVLLFIPLVARIIFEKRLRLSSNLIFNLIYSSLIGLYLGKFLPIF